MKQGYEMFKAILIASASKNKILQNDPQLKALRHMLKSEQDPFKQRKVQEAIDKRTAELTKPK